MSFDEFVNLVEQPVKEMRLLFQFVGEGEWEVDDANVMANINLAWSKPEKLHG